MLEIPRRVRHALEALAAQVGGVIARLDAEAALKESEERFHTMFESHDAIMLLVEPVSGAIVDANQAAENFYGYLRTALKSMSIHEVNIASPDEVAEARLKATEQEVNYFVFLHRLANGEVRTVEVHSSPIMLHGKEILFSIIHDITKRRQAEEELLNAKDQRLSDANDEIIERMRIEEELRQSQEMYHLLAENISDVIWILDLTAGQFRYVSPSVERLRGYTAEETAAQDMSASLTPASLKVIQERLPAAIQAFKDGYRGTYVN